MGNTAVSGRNNLTCINHGILQGLAVNSIYIIEVTQLNFCKLNYEITRRERWGVKKKACDGVGCED